MINKNQHIDTNIILKHLLDKGYALQLSDYGDIHETDIKTMTIQYSGGFHKYADIIYVRVDDYILDIRLIKIHPSLHHTFLIGSEL